MSLQNASSLLPSHQIRGWLPEGCSFCLASHDLCISSGVLIKHHLAGDGDWKKVNIILAMSREGASSRAHYVAPSPRRRACSIHQATAVVSSFQWGLQLLITVSFCLLLVTLIGFSFTRKILTTMTEKKNDEPEISVTNAVPVNDAPSNNNAAPIPPGHSRFYCSKCHAVRSYPFFLYKYVVTVCLSFFVLVFLPRTSFVSRTTCPTEQPRGDVLHAGLSIAQPRVNASGARFYKDFDYCEESNWCTICVSMWMLELAS